MLINNLTIESTLLKLKNKEFSAQELLSEYMKNIGDDKYNAFITKTFDLASEQAKIADKNIENFLSNKSKLII